MEPILRKKLISGLAWGATGQIAYYIVAFVANVLLARILLPSDFGRFGIALFFISVIRVLSESGLGGAIVRNNAAREIDYSTIFLFNLIVSCFFVVLLFVFGEYIADYYEDEELSKIISVASIMLIINSFYFIQITKVIKNMRFKAKALYDFISIVISSGIALLLGTLGFGVWSLVFMQISTVSISGLLMWVLEERVKSMKFSYQSFLFHAKFGVHTTIASVLNSVFSNINNVLIGKFFNLSQTGFYYQANRFQEAPMGVINYLNQNVIYSVLAKLQNDEYAFSRTYQKIIGVFGIITAYICLVMYVFANELIIGIFGPSWSESGFYLKILSLVGFFYTQELYVRNIFKIFDQTKYLLRLELIKKVVHTITLVVALLLMRIDLLLYGYLLTSVIAFSLTYLISRRVFPFLGLKEVSVFLRLFLILLVISSVLHYLNFKFDCFFDLILGIAITSLMYFLGLILFRLVIKEDYLLLLTSLKKRS